MFSLRSFVSFLLALNLFVEAFPYNDLAPYSPFEDEYLEIRDVCDDEPIRGVNIGGWLVLEPYINYALMGNTNAPDQWNYDKTPGAEANLQNHWATWFTEADVAQIAAWGMNTIRIPIGFWAYNNAGTPYISGADAYLQRALGWCRAHGIKVLIDLHGLPGSQNGFDNSGHKGVADWAENQANLQASTKILETMAAKYGTEAWADVVWGLELANEEVTWDSTSVSSVQTWVKNTVTSLRTIIKNPNLKLMIHDSWLGASAWESLAQTLNKNGENFYLDLHLYQNQDSSDSQLTQAQHIKKTCQYATTQFLSASANLPIVVGEFSDQTNICVDANGSISAGTSCSTTGCQCSAQLDPSQWNKYLKTATRRFLEAQMDVFEEYSMGWFFWSYTGPGAWGLGNLFDAGVIGPSTVTQREFPAQCS